MSLFTRFCNQYVVHGDTYRPKQAQKVVDEIEHLSSSGAGLFGFVNEGLPVSQLARIAQELLRRQMSIKWYASARLDRAAKDPRVYGPIGAAGCRRLFFGMESGSQRVLDRMDKGISVGDFPVIFRACKDNGIDVYLYLMVGYLGETAEDRRRTIDVVCKQGDLVDGFYISDFTAMVSSPVAGEPGRFGYKLREREDLDLQYLYEHAPLVPSSEARGSAVYEIEKGMWKTIRGCLKTKPYPDVAPLFLCYKSLQ